MARLTRLTSQQDKPGLCLQDRNSYTVFSKNKNVSFQEKKAPAGAPSPSTVLLRGILSVYKTETAILSSQKIRMSLLRRKRAPAGALSPSTVLLRGVFCT